MVKTLKCPAAAPLSKNKKPSNSTDDDIDDYELPTKSTKKRKVSETAPVQIGLQHFSDNSALSDLPGSPGRVVVIMMEHNAKPSLFFKFREAFATFLEHMHSKQDDFPQSMDEFQERYGMRFVMATEAPIQKQRPYARGAYVKHALAGEIIAVLDTFFWWRYSDKLDGQFATPEIEILLGRDIPPMNDGEYDCKVTTEVAIGMVDVPFSAFAIPGPQWHKKHASVEIKVLNKDEVRVRFEGDTWSFRSNFNALNVPGRYEDPSGQALPDDISVQEKKRACYVRII